jgi:ABC-type microcin C transport system permease subunit YejB
VAVNSAVEAFGREGATVAAAVSGGAEAGRVLVDHLFRRALLLGLLLVLTGPAAALAYCVLAARIRTSGSRSPT